MWDRDLLIRTACLLSVKVGLDHLCHTELVLSCCFFLRKTISRYLGTPFYKPEHTSGFCCFEIALRYSVRMELFVDTLRLDELTYELKVRGLSVSDGENAREVLSRNIQKVDYENELIIRGAKIVELSKLVRSCATQPWDVSGTHRRVAALLAHLCARAQRFFFNSCGPTQDSAAQAVAEITKNVSTLGSLYGGAFQQPSLPDVEPFVANHFDSSSSGSSTGETRRSADTATSASGASNGPSTGMADRGGVLDTVVEDPPHRRGTPERTSTRAGGRVTDEDIERHIGEFAGSLSQVGVASPSPAPLLRVTSAESASDIQHSSGFVSQSRRSKNPVLKWSMKF